MEAVVCTTLTAHSEPYNRAALHASRLEKGANALRSRDFGERCGREKPRLAAATSLAALDRHRQSQCLRVLQRSTAVCAGAKNTKSLAACAGSCGVGSQPMPGANAMWNTAGQVLLGDVAARDVQAATSPANRIAPARTKSWRFAGGGLGGGGENPTRQRPSLCMACKEGIGVLLPLGKIGDTGISRTVRIPCRQGSYAI